MTRYIGGDKFGETGGVGGADITLATSDAYDTSKADFVLPGAADQTLINTYLSDANVRTVRVIGKTAHVSAAVVVPNYKVLYIEGVEFVPASTTTKMWELQAGGRIYERVSMAT